VTYRLEGAAITFYILFFWRKEQWFLKKFVVGLIRSVF